MFAFGTNPVQLAHFVPLIVVLVIVAVNLACNRGYVILQARRDSRRHRAALAAELGSLLDLMRENLRLIRTDAGYLVSGKGLTAVYRGTIARLSYLREEEIAAVVPTYVLLERLEALVSSRTKAGGAVYRLEGGKADPLPLRREYQRAAVAIERTLVLLGGRSNAPESHAEEAPKVHVLAKAA